MSPALRALVIFCLSFGLPTGLPGRAAAESVDSPADLFHEQLLDSAHFVANLEYGRLLDQRGVEPALAFDIFFDRAYQRLLRKEHRRADGDLFWAQVPERTTGDDLLPVARVMATDDLRASVISLTHVPPSSMLSSLRHLAEGRDVLVIDGLRALRTSSGEVDQRMELQLELFLNEFLGTGTTVIMVDDSGFVRDVGDPLKRMSTGFPDGFGALRISTCDQTLRPQ